MVFPVTLSDNFLMAQQGVPAYISLSSREVNSWTKCPFIINHQKKIHVASVAEKKMLFLFKHPAELLYFPASFLASFTFRFWTCTFRKWFEFSLLINVFKNVKKRSPNVYLNIIILKSSTFCESVCLWNVFELLLSVFHTSYNRRSQKFMLLHIFLG